MRPSFHPRLTNGPFDDPGLYIPFLFQHRAMIFDLGDIACLSPRELLKITHAFVTHTHMDHFIGFDRLLRILLGREKTLLLFGPAGFLKNMEGRLAGYSWNLVGHYDYPLNLKITEVNSQSMVHRQYRCGDGFIPAKEPVEQPFNGILYEEPGFKVTAAILDHGIPCLGLSHQGTLPRQHHHRRIKGSGARTGPLAGGILNGRYTAGLIPIRNLNCGLDPGRRPGITVWGNLPLKLPLSHRGRK